MLHRVYTNCITFSGVLPNRMLFFHPPGIMCTWNTLYGGRCKFFMWCGLARGQRAISERRYSVPRMTLAAVRNSARSTQYAPKHAPLFAECLRYHACYIWYQPFWYRIFCCLGTFSSAFAKFWIVVISFIVSALSVWNVSTAIGRNFMKFYNGGGEGGGLIVHVEKIEVWLKSDKNKGARFMQTYVHLWLQWLLRLPCLLSIVDNNGQE